MVKGLCTDPSDPSCRAPLLSQGSRLGPASCGGLSGGRVHAAWSLSALVITPPPPPRSPHSASGSGSNLGEKQAASYMCGIFYSKIITQRFYRL